MRKAIRTSIEVFAECFAPSGPIVELGAFYPKGFEALCDLRPLFPGRQYVGCDIRPGLGVDRIEDALALTLPPGFARTMILCEILEHLPDPHLAVAEARRTLADDGLLVVSVPFQYRLHAFPTDYWRFTASGVDTLLRDFPARVTFALGPRLKPAFVFAVACKADSPQFREQSLRFEARIAEAFRGSRLQGLLKELKYRGRDFFGCLLGRAELGAAFYHPDGKSKYRQS